MDGQFRLPFRSVNCGVRNQSEISDLLVFQIGWLMKDQDYRRRVTMEGSYIRSTENIILGRLLGSKLKTNLLNL